ncbi:hypothetical protein LTR36_007233 [Oleoguttula mirabilis]|uniref:Uncharacterized protein n=1 Tax=Oleoguttula mirabilis TaxID=1507867 RepID=A0AAV9J9U5_9PEZI|nr:hypothetical protein LTR36_007233 [Oleoguttula mirabilis]
MAAQKTQAIEIPSQRRESAFLSLSPFQSTPHASPVATETVASPVSGNAALLANTIEPLQKMQRSTSESSTGSEAATSFLRLNALRDE